MLEICLVPVHLKKDRALPFIEPYTRDIVYGMAMAGCLALWECRKGKVSPEELKRGSRRRRVSETRAAIARRGSEELGLSGAEIARNLGVNTSSINRAIAKAEELA